MTFIIGVFASTIHLRIAEPKPPAISSVQTEPLDEETFFVDENKLVFCNYEVAKLKKKVNFDFGTGEKAPVENSDDMQEQAFIVSALLDYVFAGQREKGWSFFERNYRGGDKVTLRNRLRAI